MGFDAIMSGLGRFTGTDRRFEKKGEVAGVTVIDDYAHHPQEIKATLAAARNYPHRKLSVSYTHLTGWELNGLSDSETVYPGIEITEEEHTILVCTLYQPMFLWERMWGLRQMGGMQVHRWLTEACLLCTDVYKRQGHSGTWR